MISHKRKNKQNCDSLPKTLTRSVLNSIHLHLTPTGIYFERFSSHTGQPIPTSQGPLCNRVIYGKACCTCSHPVWRCREPLPAHHMTSGSKLTEGFILIVAMSDFLSMSLIFASYTSPSHIWTLDDKRNRNSKCQNISQTDS